MRNIEPLCEYYKNIFAMKFFGKEVEYLSEKELDKCTSLARIWSYKKNIIPDGFDGFNIFDFNGYDSKDQTLIINPDIALKAKDKICKYCWGVSWNEINEKQIESDVHQSFEFFSSHRKTLIDRRKSGQNIVIHSTAVGKKGRTFLASLIMKEAILLKLDYPALSYSYDWIDFTQLIEAAEKDDYDYAVYRSCDWIVIDNITRHVKSPQQKTYLIGLWNNFFLQRLEDKLPTILVLKFSLEDKTFDAESEFGSGFARIINNDNTVSISL